MSAGAGQPVDERLHAGMNARGWLFDFVRPPDFGAHGLRRRRSAAIVGARGYSRDHPAHNARRHSQVRDGRRRGERHLRHAIRLVAEHTLVADAVGYLDGHLDAPRLAALGDGRLLDGHERGELRHQPEVESELRDFVLQGSARRACLHTAPIVRHEILDARARPQARQRVVPRLAVRQIHPDFADKRARRRAPLEANRAARRARVSPHDHHGLRAEQVGNALRIDLGDGQSAPLDRDVGEQRRPHALVEAARGG